MNDWVVKIIILIGATGVGGILTFLLFSGKSLIDFDKRKKEAEEMVENAQKEANEVMENTKDGVEKRRVGFEQSKLKREERGVKVEELLTAREETIKRREERNKEMEKRIQEEERLLQKNREEEEKPNIKVVEKLIEKTGKTIEQQKEEILEKYQRELDQENLEKLAKEEERIKEDSEKIAKNIIVSTIQRLLSPTSVESRMVTVKVPKDHIKGKIVGREGTNIHVIEDELSVDVVFNDMPNTISISAFQLVNRRIAQKTIERLVRINEDITPQIIKDTIKIAENEMNEELYRIGKDALEKMSIKNDNKDFARIVGRLQYRTSYGQNIMKHSMEVAWVATMLGSELGLNLKTVRTGAFLHDLGKAIDQDPTIDKTHDVLSKELMEKFGFSDEEVHAAWTHHDIIPIETPEALIVKAADAISAGRPGARQESFDKYLDRIKKLQSTAESYKGVKKAFAISAGRELRVIVDPEQISDKNIEELAENLASQIESEMKYPGQIKVKVIRRTKHTEIAK